MPENAFLKPLETIFGVTFADRYSHFPASVSLFTFSCRDSTHLLNDLGSTRGIEISTFDTIYVISAGNT